MKERKIGESKILVSFFGIVVIALLAFITTGQELGDAINVTDNATIMVSLNIKTMIDISPENMSFGTADPGTRVGNYTNDELFGVSKTGFQLENIGSTNITNMWLNITQPSERPFATGDSSKYDAANFISASINSSPDNMTIIAQNTMSFIDRLEYNETRELVYLNLPSDTRSHGRLRSGHNEFFWALSTTGTDCNASANAVTFTIGTVAHNQTQTGTIDLVGGSVQSATLAAMYDGGFNANWSYSSASPNYITVDSPSSDYCVAAYIDCSKVRIFRWNADAPGAGTCGLSGSGYVYNSTNTELLPGDSMAMNIEMRVPFGTAMGQVKTGYLTVIAQSSESS
ncbi:MAG: hypothetical protein KAH93_00945 [Candidatus Aenigmarchaeota archaeon]|nr:hypothetical protein [Candidatus Aenigmarchaeota archaeon]